jgi:anti-sigma B factor antagonist
MSGCGVAAAEGDFMPHTSTRAQLVEPFDVESERIGGHHRVCPHGELDIATAPALERDLMAAEQTDANTIVLDLGRLSFMDSSGVHLLLHAHGRSATTGNRLRLLGGSAAVRRTLLLTGAEQRLPFVAPDVAGRSHSMAG